MRETKADLLFRILPIIQHSLPDLGSNLRLMHEKQHCYTFNRHSSGKCCISYRKAPGYRDIGKVKLPYVQQQFKQSPDFHRLMWFKIKKFGAGQQPEVQMFTAVTMKVQV
ncbi:hypothetical protein KDC22_28740 [Paenibacillus tritici]|uniref:hypothetical protein n=1 Tax=Paenibacillus tritici TaxID=1873425 RepID=UPI001BA5364D|nr:hypothetical protein [Paenibacillus tritici]QUL54254.1 hypothetical protein KDC22_28740 [Paenibacillus tritici]